MEREPDDQDVFHQRLGFGRRPAILIVDMCQAYFSSESPLYVGSHQVLKQCRILVDAARLAGHPVWWTRTEVSEASRSVFRRKVPALALFAPGHPMAAWVPGLEPQPEDRLITKQIASGFFGTGLAQDMTMLGVDTVIIAGVSTSGCVRATAVDACQHDLIPIVVREACGDRSLEAHTQALIDLDAKYADVTSMSMVVDELHRLKAPR